MTAGADGTYNYTTARAAGKVESDSIWHHESTVKGSEYGLFTMHRLAANKPIWVEREREREKERDEEREETGN